MKPNESWIHSVSEYRFPTLITFRDIGIYVKDVKGDIILLATAEKLIFEWAAEVMKDMYPNTADAPRKTNFGGKISGINWGTRSGPSQPYYVGTDRFMSQVILKWNDGKTNFNFSSYLSFREESQRFATGYFGGKLYSVLPKK